MKITLDKKVFHKDLISPKDLTEANIAYAISTMDDTVNEFIDLFKADTVSEDTTNLDKIIPIIVCEIHNVLIENVNRRL